MRFVNLLGVLTLCISFCASAEERVILPAEAFYSMPLVSSVKISPNGVYLAMLKNVQNGTQVLTYNLRTGKSFVASYSDNVDYRFNWIAWGNNERLLMSLRYESKIKKGSKHKYINRRLVSIDAHKASSPVAMVTPSEKAKFQPQYQDHILSLLPDDPDHILIGVDLEIRQREGVYKVNLNSGRMKRVIRGKASVDRWMADQSGRVRLSESYNDTDRKVTIKVLDPSSNKWAVAWQYIKFKDAPIKPIGFGSEQNQLFILADHNGYAAVFSVDLATPGYPKTLIHAKPKRDVNGKLIRVGKENRVVGMYLSGGKQRAIFWDKKFKGFQMGIDKALPKTKNYVMDMSEDARTYLLAVRDSITPGAIYVGNREDKSLVKLIDYYPELTSDVLVKKERRTYRARDGLKIEGFLSLPKGYNNTPIATIILPHGGPMSKATKGFDLLSAFLVNRGYAVFEPNFRGSTGLGHNFQMKAVGRYGMEMQEDLEDAVKYLVTEKIANPEKLCIVGASYGGYAALLGASKTPELFKCAISYAGVSDRLKMYNRLSKYSNKNAGRTLLGGDKKVLKQISPIYLAESIKAPVLLIHGLDDTVVPSEQSNIMAKKLKKLGKTYEYVAIENGTHSLNNFPQRKVFFESLEKFLATYLPVN